MLSELWKSILNIGSSKELRGIERTRVMLLNGVGAFVVVILAIYIVVLLNFGIHSFKLYLPIPVVFIAFFLNKYRQYDAARIVAIFGSIVAFTLNALWIRKMGIEYGLMVAVCSAPVLFRKNYLSYVALVMASLCYAGYQYYDMHQPFVPQPIHSYSIISTVNLYLSVGIVFFEMLVFRDLTRHYSNKLSMKNAELDGSVLLRNEYESKLKVRNQELNQLNKKLDNQVQAKTRELRSYIEAININIIVSITDGMGKIISVNDKFCAISGYSRDELIGNNHNMLNSSFHRPVFFEHMYQEITSGKSWQGKMRNMSKEGNPYWVDSVILPILDQKNQPEQFLSLQQDITELKVAEQKRNAYIRALEDIAFHTSHEIRRPLTNILGLINIIEEDTIEQEELETVAKGLKQSMDELDKATTGLYKFIHGHK